MDSYINWLSNNNYSKNTIRTYSSILKQYENNMHDIRIVKRKILEHIDSPNTCILHYNVIVTYLNWMGDKRVSKIKSIKLPQVPYIYRDIFTKKFLYNKTMINDNDNYCLIKKKMTIRFLYETGLRASELNSIKEIYEDYLVIIGKGNKERSVFYKKETFDLFYPYENSTKTLRIWVKEILGNEFSPHSIRRSFATHMLMNGANPKMVQLQLGHSKIETTFSYLNLSKNINLKIYNKFF
ncbi:MAG: tyrosine-type recombinase/integrase [Mycoplasmatales bacterium]